MSPSMFERSEPPMGDSMFLAPKPAPTVFDEGEEEETPPRGHYVTVYVTGCDSQEMADDAIDALCMGAANLAQGDDDEDHDQYGDGCEQISAAMHVRGERVQLDVVRE